jgi:hypothetical protein
LNVPTLKRATRASFAMMVVVSLAVAGPTLVHFIKDSDVDENRSVATIGNPDVFKAAYAR